MVALLLTLAGANAVRVHGDGGRGRLGPITGRMNGECLRGVVNLFFSAPSFLIFSRSFRDGSAAARP